MVRYPKETDMIIENAKKNLEFGLREEKIYVNMKI